MIGITRLSLIKLMKKECFGGVHSLVDQDVREAFRRMASFACQRRGKWKSVRVFVDPRDGADFRAFLESDSERCNTRIEPTDRNALFTSAKQKTGGTERSRATIFEEVAEPHSVSRDRLARKWHPRFQFNCLRASCL